MKTPEHKLHKWFSILFWANIIVIVILFLIILWMKGPDFGNIPTNVAFERWAIILTLGSIPFALKMFHTLLSKTKGQEKAKIIKRYKQLFIARLLLLDSVATMNIIGFQIYESSNFIYMTIVIIFALFFCYPDKNICTEPPIEEINEITED